MASPQAPEKFAANNAFSAYDFDPDSTNAATVGWVDMRDYETLTVFAFASALTGNGANAFSIVADPDSDGASGTNVTVVSHSIASNADAVGDWLMLECTAEQIAQEGEDGSQTDLRYVSAKIGVANAADEQVVIYIRSGAKRPIADLSADYISA